jgi:hypothetical protein
LFFNTTGNRNAALGQAALFSNTTGSNNIGLGTNAGLNLTTGSNNIDIGSGGLAAEANTTRIGTQGTQTRAFIAGISGTAVSGSAVVVNGAGQLGIVVSSARYKHDIQDMGLKSSALLKLRPVTFRYNNDPANTLQYGLVAEEVARVYPELVTRGPDGKVQTVNYLTLTSMLLNELQKQNVENRRQAEELRLLKTSTVRKLEAVQERLAAMEQAMQRNKHGENLADAR